MQITCIIKNINFFGGLSAFIPRNQYHPYTKVSEDGSLGALGNMLLIWAIQISDFLAGIFCLVVLRKSLWGYGQVLKNSRRRPEITMSRNYVFCRMMFQTTFHYVRNTAWLKAQRNRTDTRHLPWALNKIEQEVRNHYNRKFHLQYLVPSQPQTVYFTRVVKKKNHLVARRQLSFRTRNTTHSLTEIDKYFIL